MSSARSHALVVLVLMFSPAAFALKIIFSAQNGVEVGVFWAMALGNIWCARWISQQLSNAEARLTESEGSVHHLRSLLNGIYGKVGAEATKRTVVVEVGVARTNKDVS